MSVLVQQPAPDFKSDAVMPDGTHLGRVTVCKGKTSAKVTDYDALTEWVQANHPHHIMTATSVRPAFLASLLAACSLPVAAPLAYSVGILGILGTALFFGDGMITPAISVLSAVEGLAVSAPPFAPYVEAVTVGGDLREARANDRLEQMGRVVRRDEDRRPIHPASREITAQTIPPPAERELTRTWRNRLSATARTPAASCNAPPAAYSPK